MLIPSDLAIEAVVDPDWVSVQRRERWRRRLLPLAGGAALLFVWWAAIAVFHVRSFMAPAPDVVATTLYEKFDMLMANLEPCSLRARG